MRKLFLLIALLAGFQPGLKAQWQLRNSGINVGYSITGNISIPSEKTAYAIGDNSFPGLTGLTYYTKTTNGGLSWIAGSVPNTQGMLTVDIASTSDDTVYLLINDNPNGKGRIYKSVDGGGNWVQQGLNTFNTTMARGIHFFNANEGVVFSDENANNYKEIYTTSDGGANWVRVPQANIPPPVPSEYTAFYTTYGNAIWFGNIQGRIYRSFDKGHTWAVSKMPAPALKVLRLAFSDVNNGLAIANTDPYSPDYKGLFRTTDGGITWTDITPPLVDIFYTNDICYVPGTKSTFVVAGFDQTNNGNLVKGSCYSTDGGTTWEVMSTNLPREPTCVKYFNQAVAYAGTYAITAPGGANAYLGGIYQFTFKPDVGVTAITSPVSECYKYTEPVCVEVKNFGLFPASNIPVKFSVNGGVMETAIIPGPIAPWATKSFCFPSPALLQGSGPYTLHTGTTMNGDLILNNDTLSARFIAAAAPTSSFDTKPDTGRTFYFRDLSAGAKTFEWHFGDNDTSHLPSPSHRYAADGQYLVKLITANAMGCSDTATMLLKVKYALPPDTTGPVTTRVTRIYPNPTTGMVTIELKEKSLETRELEVYSAIGQLVRKKRITGAPESWLNMSGLPAGMYTIKITGNSKPKLFKLVLLK